MAVLYVESAHQAGTILSLVQSAIESQIAQLELAVKLADKRLAPYEQKYNTTSEQFMAWMTAEDLQGGDDEYVHWAGEYQLRQRLQDKLRKLQGIEYRA